MYYLTVSLGQEFSSGSAEWSWLMVSDGAAVSSESSSRGGSASRFTHVIVSRPQFLDRWTSPQTAWKSSYHTASFPQNEWWEREGDVNTRRQGSSVAIMEADHLRWSVRFP